MLCSLLRCSILLLSSVLVYALPSMQHHTASEKACRLAQAQIDGDGPIAVYFPGSQLYDLDISHFSNASTLPAACSVEPSSVEDVQALVSIINATRTPWAVKGGGHCNNQNMSSTVGLQISMSQFTDFKISSDRRSVTIGAGLTWADVYAALDQEALIVLGGRFDKVGVAGLTLSSGYSWLTNQYGFAIDNVVSIDVVLPNGTYAQVNQDSDAELFAAFQGGVNNFGIVTQLTISTFPIGEVYGGIIHVTGAIEAAIDATTIYANTTTDPKATLAAVFNAVNGTAGVSFILFYDGPSPPSGLFDPFLQLPNATVDVKVRSYLEFALATELTFEPNNRATWYSAPILSWPKELISFIVDEMTVYSKRLATETKSGTLVSGNVEPFLPQAYSFDRGSAWPHSSSNAFNTFNGLFVWDDPADDEAIIGMTVEYHTSIWEKAIGLGVSRKEAYFPPNYSQRDTTVRQIYGDNLPWLRRVQKRVDPWGIVALTGGFKI